ncbi:hypothetical protein AYL99_10702 [Fonsecaea erecta]|uniref:Zn(2)-C6 fungal-type domain-containing protein n=1 Tax=Fonsecaea erecta TaxID=1367422 RepID=A0A178Z5L2_9EURO|nr:hypothetical protein AYL99_10702 [Fonsecaea erecta]OAP55002.1 hypothetical protein AYL99_10702 [Fonsecaea erecta]
MDDRREAKRARQACLNCRRKKTRCSGEKPVCAFCARLNQRCTWDGDEEVSPDRLTDTGRASFSSGIAAQNASLAARVALLESRLSFLDADSAFNLFASVSPQPTSNQPADQPPVVDEIARTNSDFTSLPDPAIFRSLVQVYFDRCHNQPYAFFHEEMFRHDYESGSLPEYLLYAFAAAACRFSDHEFYQQRRAEAIDTYAQVSFGQIFEHSFSDAESLEPWMVVALAILAVVDFAAGRPKIGWVKLALSCRFAHALRLNEEPDSQLPVHEQEERRRIFWSVYLLDIIMSVGPNRPPSLLDEDCTVRLPCHEGLFRDGLDGGPVPNLTTVVENPSGSNHQNLDPFAMTVIMASALGRFIRFSLKRTLNTTHVLWDPRSKYYEVHSILLYYEAHSLCALSSISEALNRQPSFIESASPSQVSHIVYAHALYHLNNCLLNHPFILYRFFQAYTAPVPLSFVQEALQRCRKHATNLLELLADLESYGPLSHPSFYGYCAMAAGVIHSIYEKSDDAEVAQTSRKHLQAALNFLQREPVRWGHVNHMGTLLRSFKLDPAVARVLTNPVSLAQKVTVPLGNMLWQLLDYAWLPRNIHPGENKSSVADLLPGTGHLQSNMTETLASNGANPPGGPFNGTGVLPPTYARMLGEDMGDILSEAMGDNRLQGFVRPMFSDRPSAAL